MVVAQCWRSCSPRRGRRCRRSRVAAGSLQSSSRRSPRCRSCDGDGRGARASLAPRADRRRSAWFMAERTRGPISGLHAYWADVDATTSSLFDYLDTLTGGFRARAARRRSRVVAAVAWRGCVASPAERATRAACAQAVAARAPVLHPWYLGWALVFEPLRAHRAVAPAFAHGDPQLRRVRARPPEGRDVPPAARVAVGRVRRAARAAVRARVER